MSPSVYHSAIQIAVLRHSFSSREDLSNMQLTDASGKLAQIAESLMQTISEDPSLASSLLSPQQGEGKANRKATSTFSGEADAMVDVTAGSSPTQSSSIEDGEDIPALTLTELLSLKDVDAACQTDPVSLRYPGRRIQGISFHTDGLDLDRQPVQLFEELHAFWTQHVSGRHPPQLFDVVPMELAFDTRLTRTADHMSKAIVDFRNGARRAIQAGARLDDILGSNMPSLETFHSQDPNTPIHSAWSWACQFTRAFPELPLTTQLSTIYLVGIQMRFFIHPNADTFDDLPPMLRPLRKQYTVEHAASIDICYFPALKDFLLDNQHQYSSLFIKIISTQSCNWPYSEAACFNNCNQPSHTSTLSRAFIEHIRNGQNFTIGAEIFEEAPQLKAHVR
ncbi:hypothetical protein LTR64_002609 [Lithohypha guttulata]|uniref:uncharacterized protein n=1 Tax=Lithohypha guttulata TaxID=1690604 RepID=UPI002DE06961|nr:hypothetical protein LTR51_001166 [Lithohypha guttulata]